MRGARHRSGLQAMKKCVRQKKKELLCVPAIILADTLCCFAQRGVPRYSSLSGYPP